MFRLCLLANAGSGTGSSGIGLGAIEFDTDTNELSWTITWSGLTGTATAMHFHGPALPNQNAGVQLATALTSQPVMGSAILTAGQVTDLLNGLWYLNLHSAAHPGGEIRGTVARNTVANESRSWDTVKGLFK